VRLPWGCLSALKIAGANRTGSSPGGVKPKTVWPFPSGAVHCIAASPKATATAALAKSAMR
jgi:hypothetical protein